MNPFDSALILTGPTASGKTGLSLELAERVGGEIVCADSMTVYRGMDIGTAKPTPAERARVPHFGLDELDASESASVAWWLARAAAWCGDIAARGKRPLVVGGTPFYLKALLYGLFDAPPADANLRAELEAEATDSGAAALHARLAAVDPASAARLHPNDARRVVRALEVFALTGRPISQLQTSWAGPPRPVPVVALDWPRDELTARIDARIDAMVAAGWVAEAGRVAAASPGREAACALGYRELAAVARGEAELAPAVEFVKLRTRQFAKRQMTFLRGIPAWRGCDPVNRQCRTYSWRGDCYTDRGAIDARFGPQQSRRGRNPAGPRWTRPESLRRRAGRPRFPFYSLT